MSAPEVFTFTQNYNYKSTESGTIKLGLFYEEDFLFLKVTVVEPVGYFFLEDLGRADFAFLFRLCDFLFQISALEIEDAFRVFSLHPRDEVVQRGNCP